ncbi:DUF389 domain-containing protein [Erythrobacteraceae bacterium CFH 75059]|uniref:DUF389 domain-containing protein n=1 Tax=Qipengyuania thermophila TaxID=2509361 RepID=UPI00101EF381|nr:DUF389 domain-containing protein [Qipengyuania thermophila]TCD06517.1 DUF389 domain-containing protein [Erythrobacteraceae bacterium CFH 75059]
MNIAGAASASATPERAEQRRARHPRRWQFGPVGRALARLRRHWRDHGLKDLDHSGVVLKIKGEAALTWRYAFMTAMSAGIAILGMLLSSPAVVIGAMLLSPLMGPMLGAGFALAIGNQPWLRRSVTALVAGMLVAIAFSALLVFASPLQTVTSEIAARTRPNLFDLLVALFSALAGSYAMIRGREGAIVGVAIAVAVMPPLGAVGFGLATMNWTVFSGALLLFFTNAMTITLTAAIMARIYGFGSHLSGRSSTLQNIFIALAFLALAVPLGLTLRQIAFEANSQRIIQNAIADQFDSPARINALEVEWDSQPLTVRAVVLTPEYRARVEQAVRARLEQLFDRPVRVSIEQLRVGTGSTAVEPAAPGAANRAAAAEREVARLTEQIALIAGAPRAEVMLDRVGQRAFVPGRALAGVDLRGWRQLERRAQDAWPDWEITVRPPPAQLPALSGADGGDADTNAEALAVIAWGARRTGLAVVLTGRGAALAAAAERLRDEGVAVSERTGSEADRIVAEWEVPEG